MLSTALGCVTRSRTDPVAMPIVLEYALPRQGDVRHSIQLGLMCNETLVAQVATCEVVTIVLLHSSCLEGNTDLDSELTCKVYGLVDGTQM